MENIKPANHEGDERVRVQFEVLAHRFAQLEQLMRETDLNTKKDLFENALTLFEWAVEETKAGNTVGTYDPRSETFQRLIFAPLRNLLHVKRQEKTVEKAHTPSTYRNQAAIKC